MTVMLGLGSRRYAELLPEFVGLYAGDTVWGLMLYFGISAFLPRSRILIRTSVAIVVAFAVELSQLYHASWIDAIRQTTLGGLALGFGFLWTDLVCYTVGVVSGAVAELGLATRPGDTG